MTSQPTFKQHRLLEYLRREILIGGETPSLRKTAEDLGITHAAVAQMLKTLEEKGYLKREGRYSRNIRLLNRFVESSSVHRWKEIPIVGRITAGVPIYAQQEWSGGVVVDESVFRGKHLFALRVNGDSMKDAGILDGDLAICRPRQYAVNGEIVVALINEEEATIKRFFLFDDHIELRPENPRYSPGRYSFDEILIQGKVTGIHRGPEGISHLT